METIVSSPSYRMASFWSSTPAVNLTCPANAPKLEPTEFHRHSGWRIPVGVEIVLSTDSGTVIPTYGSGVDVFFAADSDPASQRWSIQGQATNWTTEARNVQVRLHCAPR